MSRRTEQLRLVNCEQSTDDPVPPRHEPGSAVAKAKGRHHPHVYVVELSERVRSQSRFPRANPEYDLTKPCAYVGKTGLDLTVRTPRHPVHSNNMKLHLKRRHRPIVSPLEFVPDGSADWLTSATYVVRCRRRDRWVPPLKAT